MNMTKMFREAKKAGVATENKMWQSVALMEPILEMAKDEHPDEYWHMMRDQHELLYGPHYNDEFSNYDIEQIHWTDKNGTIHHGAHWSKEQIADATQNMLFPAGTTDCDKFVAFNSYYADMCHDKDEGTILADAHKFYFKDEDAPAGKIWHYMKAMHNAGNKQ